MMMIVIMIMVLMLTTMTVMISTMVAGEMATAVMAIIDMLARLTAIRNINSREREKSKANESISRKGDNTLGMACQYLSYRIP